MRKILRKSGRDIFDTLERFFKLRGDKNKSKCRSTEKSQYK